MPPDRRRPNLMAAHEVCRCARCGNLPVAAVRSRRAVLALRRRSAQLRAVRLVRHQRALECTQSPALPARVAPKDVRNSCSLFTPRTTVERQTGTPAASERRLVRHEQRQAGVRGSLQIGDQTPQVIITGMALICPGRSGTTARGVQRDDRARAAAVLHADARLRDRACRRGRFSTSCRRCPTGSRSRK